MHFPSCPHPHSSRVPHPEPQGQGENSQKGASARRSLMPSGTTSVLTCLRVITKTLLLHELTQLLYTYVHFCQIVRHCGVHTYLNNTRLTAFCVCFMCAEYNYILQLLLNYIKVNFCQQWNLTFLAVFGRLGRTDATSKYILITTTYHAIKSYLP